MVQRNEDGKLKKGSVLNPKGRPKKEREQAYYDVLVSSVSVDDWQAIITRAVSDAKKGDPVARKWLADYLIGPPVQRQEVTGKDGTDLVLLKVVKGVSVDDL
jgi:hypothetical protein